MTSARKFAVVGAVVGLVAIVIGAGALLGSGSRGAQPGKTNAIRPAATHTDTAHTAPTATRTLVVSAMREPAPSLPGATMRAVRVGGTIPARASLASVMTDEDCAPDAAGVSHCINKVRLQSGAVLTVRHPHRMAQVPCMTPGERIRVQPA